MANDTEKRGLTAAGTQRWRCRRCGPSFVWSNPANSFNRQRIWFKRWLVEGYAVRQIAAMSGKSPCVIRGVIRYWLDRPPATPTDLSGTKRIIIDGTFIEGRSAAALAVMDADRREIVFGGYGIKEKPVDLRRTFCALRDQGLSPFCATVDGNPSVLRILREVWPEIRIQRCLIHVQRQGLMWCRIRPKRTDARKLRLLFLAVTEIRSTEGRDRFLAAVSDWDRRYGRAIEERGEHGWVASDLRRARSMLLQARDHLFTFLDDPVVPSNTNSLEGYFGRLKERYRRHRGLSVARRDAYFRWYFYLCKR